MNYIHETRIGATSTNKKHRMFGPMAAACSSGGQGGRMRLRFLVSCKDTNEFEAYMAKQNPKMLCKKCFPNWAEGK